MYNKKNYSNVLNMFWTKYIKDVMSVVFGHQVSLFFTVCFLLAENVSYIGVCILSQYTM